MRKLLPFCGLLLVLIAAISGCGGGSNSTSITSMQAGVTVHISDPNTCSGPNGPFKEVWVTISDVRIHTSSSAGPNDAGWVDLTPNLKDAPMQVNLLGIPDNTCFLATLGDLTEIQPGTFQQIRLILADNSQASKIAGGVNHCSAGVTNCVVFTAGGSQALQLSSETQTGIKIPSGQIAGGQFTVAAGQTVDLDIDFNTCASIVMQGNGQARLKPVLHAGEVSLQTGTSINGTIVDSSDQPISGGKVLVMLAQPGAPCSGAGCVSNVAIEDVKMETTADASGNFFFCPVPPGTYDVIAIAFNGGTAYAATVTTGVQPGNTLTGLAKIKLIAAGAQATINGTVTTTSATNTAIAEDVTVVPLQAVSANLLIPIPQFGASTTTTITTAVPNPPGHTCSSNTVACNDYSLLVPAGNPNVGVFNPMGTIYTQAPAPVNYIADGLAALCSPTEEQTNQRANPPGGTLTVTAGNTVTASTLAFTGCQ
jgi:hypothetical protein